MGKAKKMAREREFQFVGHYSCLDFVNTQFAKEDRRRIDLLRSFADLINWLGESRLLNRAKRGRCGAHFSRRARLAQCAARYGRKARDTAACATGIT